VELKDAQTLMKLLQSGQTVLCNLAPDMFCLVVSVHPDKMLVTLIGPDGDELKEVTNSLTHASKDLFFVTQAIAW